MNWATYGMGCGVRYGSEAVEVCAPIHCSRRVVGIHIAPRYFWEDDAEPLRYDEEVFVSFSGYQTHCTET